MRWILGLVVATGCSYGAAFSDCEIPCHSPEECPASLTCGPEGLCRINNNTISCMAVLGDAHLHDDGGPGDGSSNAHCTGTPTGCPVLSSSATCGAQTGCAWTAPACTLTTDCTQYTTNTACMNAPGCHTDFSTSTCRPTSGYCTGSTQSQCEATQDCAYAGGCNGTARPCAMLATSATCGAQAGCSWH